MALLPTTLTAGSTIYVGYLIQNNTQSQRNNNFIKYLPPNVSVSSGGCSGTFSLAPNGQSGDSCVLNLAVTGAINGNDPDPHHHLFACFPGGTTCTGTASPLSVSVVSQATLVALDIAPISTTILNGESEQYTATGYFFDGTTQNLTSSVQWSSSNTSTVTINNSGFATAISPEQPTLLLSGSIEQYGFDSGHTHAAIHYGFAIEATIDVSSDRQYTVAVIR